MHIPRKVLNDFEQKTAHMKSPLKLIGYNDLHYDTRKKRKKEIVMNLLA